MNMKFKKALVLGMATMLFASSTGCSGGPKEDTNKAAGEVSQGTKDQEADKQEVSADEPGWKKHSGEKIDLDWYINFSWFTTPWGEDMTSKKITEDTGVNVNFIVPAGNEAEKLNTMIASDTLPDILTLGWWEGQVNEMIDSEMVYALNELADQYDPYFFKVADNARIGWYTQPDGNIYGYPNSSYTPSDYEKYDNIASNQTFLVRKDMYEVIGSPDMSTPEGFLNALKKAKEMFPEVNGQPLIPIGFHEFGELGNFSFEEYLQNFLAVPYEKDGKYYDRYTDPDYINWLKTFSKAGQEGLLANDVFIDKRAQMEEKIAQGRYFAMMYQRTDMANQQKILFENDPNSIYMAVEGPKNANGDDHTLPGVGIAGWTVTMISKNCKDPERAIQLMTYLMSEEGQKLTYLGIEGQTYDIVDGKPVVKQEVKDLLKSDRAAYDRKYGADNTFWMFQDLAMQAQWSEGPQEPLKQLEEWTYPYTEFISQYEGLNPAVGTEEEVINLKARRLFGETLPKLLLAGSDSEFDQIYNKFLEDRNALGYDKVVAVKQTMMDDNKAKLGLK
nr:extracellular solute-binding protein [uncultured Niameybacter sp.]